MKHKIKMIGFDLDGTLLTTQKTLTERTRRALTEAVSKGVVILPATGRPITGVPDEVLHFPGVKYAVTANGARVVEVATGRVIYEKLLPAEKARKILDIFEEYDTLREIYYDGKGYAEEALLAQVDRYVPLSSMAAYVASTRVPVSSVREKFEAENRALDKIQALFADEADKKDAWRRVEQIEGVEVTGALSNIIEVNEQGVQKGAALLRLGEQLGICREEIMAFGDGANDVMMIKTVGTGVAMANGIPQIIQAADILAESNDEDGVAKVIEQYVLG